MNPSPHSRKRGLSKESYAALRREVEDTLFAGRRIIEEARVQTYWKTGRLIRDHIDFHAGPATEVSAGSLQNKTAGQAVKPGSRAARRTDLYGKQIVTRLADDLRMSPAVLWRCVQFARSFEIVAGRRESFSAGLTWSHYRELLTVSDKSIRSALMQRAVKGGWTAEQLSGKIRQEFTGKKSLWPEGAAIQPPAALQPKRGVLNMYRLVVPQTIRSNNKEPLMIDLGFKVYRKLSSSQDTAALKEGMLVEIQPEVKSEKGRKGQSVSVSRHKPADLYSYRAVIERVVDGDTLLVHIHLGWDTSIRQYLRLRGIDAPPLSEPGGKKARDFILRELRAAPGIILTSTRTDKYDRYLADVFFEGQGEEIFLNQRLLDEGLVQRV